MTEAEEALYEEIDKINAAIKDLEDRLHKVCGEKDDLMYKRSEYSVSLATKVAELRKLQGEGPWHSGH